MRTFALAILFCLFSPLAHADAPWVPVQADLSAGGNYGRYDQHPIGSLYLGFAALEDGIHGAGFFGAGIEGTVSDYRSPYQWTAGLGTRVGTAWRWRPAVNARIPDLYLYARVMPIIGGGQQGTDLPNGDIAYDRYKIGGGIRVGIGMTAPGWTVMMANAGWNGLSNIGDFGGGDEYATLGCAAACLTYFVLTIVNHAELTWETYGTESRAMYGRVGFRIGTGF